MTVATEEDYRKEIHYLVDHIKTLKRIRGVYSYVNRVHEIQNEEKEEAGKTLSPKY